MWVDAGFVPDHFWQQTPHTFQLAMQGVRKRMERDVEASISAAYQAACFNSAAQAGKLKPLKHYLKRPVTQTQSQMLANMRAIAARVNKKGTS